MTVFVFVTWLKYLVRSKFYSNYRINVQKNQSARYRWIVCPLRIAFVYTSDKSVPIFGNSDHEITVKGIGRYMTNYPQLVVSLWQHNIKEKLIKYAWCLPKIAPQSLVGNFHEVGTFPCHFNLIYFQQGPLKSCCIEPLVLCSDNKSFVAPA